MNLFLLYMAASRKLHWFILDDFYISVQSYSIWLLGPVGYQFFAVFRHLLFPRSPLIRELGKRDDRFMDSLDSGGNGGSRVVVGGSAKRRQTQECIASPAAIPHIPIERYVYDTNTNTHTHIRGYFSQCITVHLFCSPWPTKLANQIRSRPSRRRRLEQPRKGSNLFAAGRIAGTVKSSPRRPATHIPLNTTALNISRGGRKRLTLYDY